MFHSSVTASWLRSLLQTPILPSPFGEIKRKAASDEDQGGSAHDEYLLLEQAIRNKDLKAGRRMHRLITNGKYDQTTYLWNALIRLFAACGTLSDAKEVFRKVPNPDLQTWQAIIFAHAFLKQGEQAIRLYHEMRIRNLEPNSFVYVAVLMACTSTEALTEGRVIHEHIVLSGCESDLFVASTLLDMYAKCGSLEEAQMVFSKMEERDVVSWNAIIGAHVLHGQCLEALGLYGQMQLEGLSPDERTYGTVLNACGSLRTLEEGRRIHLQLISVGFDVDVITGNILLDMYVKCGSLEDADEVFKSMATTDVVSWTTMIGGYVQAGHGEEALRLYQKMQQEGIKPDKVTFVNLLKWCASIAALEEGKQIHTKVVENKLELDLVVANTLIDMYVKCGKPDEAQVLFKKLPRRSVVSWNAMISGLSLHGRAKEALLLFQQMQEEGIKPNDVTMVCVLSACSRAGMVDEGYHTFRTMWTEFGILPEEKHYACMVDLFGRAGHLSEAEELIKNMPVQPEVGIWVSFLAACHTHGNVELGRRAFESIITVEPRCEAAYALMSNIYSAAGMSSDEGLIRKMMSDVGVQKIPGRSWLDLNSQVHSFAAEDTDHPERTLIYAELSKLLHSETLLNSALS